MKASVLRTSLVAWTILAMLMTLGGCFWDHDDHEHHHGDDREHMEHRD